MIEEWVISAVGPFPVTPGSVAVDARARQLLIDAGWTPPREHAKYTHHFTSPPAGSVDVCMTCHELWPCPTIKEMNP